MDVLDKCLSVSPGLCVANTMGETGRPVLDSSSSTGGGTNPLGSWRYRVG